MANKSRFVIAESKIKAFFSKGSKVYQPSQLYGILEEYRAIWNLPVTMSGEKFFERLVSSGILTHKEINLENKKERYLTANASEFDVAASMIHKCYLSHYTAVFLHGLTNQVPKAIYITSEQSKKTSPNRGLLQEAVDQAFSRPQRQSATVAPYEDFGFILLKGMSTGRAGVTILNELPVTNLERTLIDIAVRPNYAGGVTSVLNAYDRAVETVSINKLVATLDRMNFIYPYHQAIGFYLERTSIDDKRIDVFRKMHKEIDFYLTYEMAEMEYSEEWRLYYPKGM